MNSLSRRSVLTMASAAAVTNFQGAQAQNTTDVIVIGAGLSGLHSAWLLEQEGHAVTVLEARNRVGGRVWTLDDLSGRPEVGATSIGPGYGRVLDVVDRLGVELTNERPRTFPNRTSTLLTYENKMVRSQDWVESEVNSLPNHIRDQMPYEVTWGYLPSTNPLKGLADWIDPAFSSYDQPFSDHLYDLGFNERAISLIGSPLGYGYTPYNTSALHMFHVWSFLAIAPARDSSRSFAAAGGMQRIPEAMARALKRPVLFNSEVRAIEENGRQMEVRCSDGRKFVAKAVISTLPIPVLRMIHIDPPLSGIQGKAIANLPSHNTTLTFFDIKSRYWENDGLPPNMWGDTLAGRFFVLPYAPDGTVSETASANLALAYSTGLEAARVERLGPTRAAEMIIRELAVFRPVMGDALKYRKTVGWSSEKFSQGAYGCWYPGQVTLFARDLRKPRGRLVFAGDHFSVSARGMEGAMESAERATLEVLDIIA